MDIKQNEIERLKALLSYNIIDTLKEEEFDKLAQLASIICETPIALISLIDDKRQWYKAKVGIEANEMPKELTFCQFTIQKDHLWVVEDATKNDLLKDNPNVTAEDGIRFYAGLPLQSVDGYNIGTLCVADIKPKKISEKEKIALQIITEQIMILLEARKRNLQLITELREIIDHKEIESKKIIEKTSGEFKTFYESISNNNGIIEIDINGVITSTNEVIGRLLRAPANKLIGLDFYNFFALDRAHNSIEELIEKKNFLLEYQSSIAQKKWIQANFVKITDYNDVIIKIILICQDVTSRVRWQQELEKSKRISEFLNQQKDRFIANVSHEIRTPINAILGFTDILFELEKDSLKLEYLNSIKVAGIGLLNIINDILDISKIEAGMIKIDEAPFQLEECISNAFTVLKLKAKEKGIKFLYSIDSDVHTNLIGDKHRLNQILINLLGNSIKFTANGKVELKVSLLDVVDQVCHIEFRISDTGIGISQEKLQSIFDRFSQAEVSTTRKFGGTGLGLSITKELVEIQNGKIRVESKENEGTTFVFVIPFKINQTNEKIVYVKGEVELLDLSPKKILLCEDNELNQKLILSIFKSTPYTILIANNGQEGLDLLAKNTFDLVFMDLQMPIMDGFETTKNIRENLKLQMPIIALTANSLIYEKEICLKLGMNDFLTKPFTKKELFEVLNRTFTGNSISIPSKPNEETISLTSLKEFIGEDTEQLNEIINSFQEQLEKFLSSIEGLFLEKKFQEIRLYAHKMKTSFGMFSISTEELVKIESTDDEDFVSNGITIFKPLLDQIEDILVKLKNVAL